MSNTSAANGSGGNVPANMQVIGTCSICGGRVLQYVMLHIVGPFPPARCERCGGVEAEQHGPVIPMRPSTGAEVR